MTGHDQVLDMVLGLLKQYPALADGQVHEVMDVADLPEDVPRAICVSFDLSDPSQSATFGGPIDWSTTLRISCVVRKDNRDVIDGRPAFALQAQVHEVLVQPGSMGPDVGLVECLRLQADQRLLDTRIAVVHGVYRVMHRTDATLAPQP